jgi:hypothetical protein
MKTVNKTLDKIYELALGESTNEHLGNLSKGQMKKRIQQIKACIRSYRNENS